MLLERIESKAGIKFKKVGAPQPEDLLKASSRDIVLSLRSVSTEAAQLFREVADELVEELGAQEALARAIAYISGYTQKMK
jgi:ATP-dependent RNA helicase DDX21